MKKVSWLLIFLLCIVLLTGCWNRRELNELALVVAMSIDKSEDEYLVTVQVVDPGEVAAKAGSGGSRTPVTIYSGKGKHLFEAVRRMTTITPRKLYFSHLQMFIVSEDVAKEGINNILDFLTRDSEFREDFYIVVSKDIEAQYILQNVTSIEKIPANKLHSSLETSQRAWAPTVKVQMDDLISSLTSDGKNPVLTGITLTGDNQKGQTLANVERINPFARLKYSNIAVFNKDQMVGWLNEKESKGYNYITNNVKNTIGSIPCSEEDELVIEIIRSKAKVKGKVENGKPKIDISVYTEANVGEVACKIDLTKPQSIKELEKKGHEVLEDILMSAVNRAKDLEVDIFGFGEVIHRTDPKAWKSLKKDWNQEFVKLPITVHSELKIRRTGTLNQSFIEKEKE